MRGICCCLMRPVEPRFSGSFLVSSRCPRALTSATAKASLSGTGPRQRQAHLHRHYPSPKDPRPVPRLFFLVTRSKLWTTFPTLAFTTSKAACGEWMWLSTSMFCTKDIHSGSGSVRFQAMLTWNMSERSIFSCSVGDCAVGELASIGPSPLPPEYNAGCPDFCAASLHALRSLFNSLCAGFLMPSTKNHRFRS